MSLNGGVCLVTDNLRIPQNVVVREIQVHRAWHPLYKKHYIKRRHFVRARLRTCASQRTDAQLW